MAHYGFGEVFPPAALIPHNNQGQLRMTRWPVEAVLLGRVDVLITGNHHPYSLL